jgi:hypothetical protein
MGKGKTPGVTSVLVMESELNSIIKKKISRRDR